MYEAAATCKDIVQVPVTKWEMLGVTLAGYSYTMMHGMKVQILTPFPVRHL
jgi:hypothetical protein